MASRIKLKSSTTPNSVPQISDLSDREVALNINDRSLFINDGGTIREVLNADPNDETIVPSMLSSSITDGAGNTWYVSENGTDKATLGSVNPRHGETTGANAWGKTPMTAFASLKYALDNYAQAGDTVVVEAGTYTETFPLTVPVDVSVKGRGIKSVFIQPTVATNDLDAFLIEGNCNIEDLTVRNFYYNDTNDTGYGFRLASGFTLTERRPYIQRVSVLTKGSVTSAADPRGYDEGDAGRGALVDGSVANSSTIEASLLFNECTFVVPNSVGLYLKNGARCEWLNSFTYYAQDGIIGENPSGGTGLGGVARTRLNLEGESGDFSASGGNVIGLLDETTSNVSTTYTSSGVLDNLTVIISSASHGLSIGDAVYVSFTSGNQSGVVTFATVADVPTTDSFEISGVYSGTADIGSVTYRVAKAYGSINENDGTYVYISGQGEGRFEAVDEITGKIVNKFGDVKTVTAQSQFGSTSAVFDGTDDRLTVASDPDFNFSSGDYTLEAFVYLNNVSGSKAIIDFRNQSTEIAPLLYINGTTVRYYVNGSDVINGGALTANQWYHIALSRSGQQTKVFVNGSQVGSTYTDANDFPTRGVTIGYGFDGTTLPMNGYIDEVRISKGIGRYTTNFTTPSAAFVADQFTSLLLHMEGADQAAVFVDDSIVSQEVVTTGGGTANFITLADYTGFGAELRSISSANVYGERGATADGKGVSLRLVSHNFGYIGVGKEDNNDTSLVVQSNEVNEQSDGRIFFTSIDQSGDFRVGTLFLVDQEKGTLSFAGQGSGGGTGTSFDQLLVSAGSDTTTILPTSIEVGNFTFFGNTISTNSGAINLTPFTGEDVSVTSRLSLNTFTGQESSKLSLNFDTDLDTGIRKPNLDGQFTLVSNGGAVARVLPNEFRLSTDTNISTSIADSVGISDAGSGYAVGDWTGVPVAGGTGTGMTVDFTVTAFNGTISNAGSGYTPGVYTDQTLINVSSSGTGGEANITVKGIGGGTIVGGAGYTDETYADVPLNGGTGSGALATIFVGGGAVTDVFISNEGNNAYVAGDVLTINTSDLTYIDENGDPQVSGGAGFSYTVPSDLYTVTQVVQPTTTWSGVGYATFDTVTATLPGGSNFEFTFNQIQFISSVVITPDPANPDEDLIAGVGYELGDRVTPSFGLTSSDTLLGAGTTVTYNVQVRNTAGGDRFFINTGSGYTETPNLTLNKDTLYKFVFAPDGTYPGTYDEHPLSFSTTPDGIHSAGVAYTTLAGALNAGNGAYIIVTEDTPGTLYYYCPNHADMGGSGGNEAIVDTSADTTYGQGGEFSIDSATLENFISLSKEGNIGAENLSLVQNASIEGNLTVLGTTNLTTASAQNLTVSGVLNASGGIGTSGNLTVAGDLGTNGRLTVAGSNTDPTTIAGDVKFDTDLLQIDATNNKVSILGPTLDTEIEDYTFEVNSTAKIYNHTFLATDNGSVVSIGLDPGPADIATTLTEKFTVTGDSRFNGKVLFNDGTETAPSITFDSDDLLGYYKSGANEITTVGYNGPIMKQTTSQISFFKPVDLINKAIDQYTITPGRGYTIGTYQDVLFRGGTGADFTADVTVAFTGDITVAGSGYTDETYTDVPVQYVSVASGAITIFGTLTPGSNYVDGTYANIALNGGTGTLATGDFTVTNGAVTSVVINAKGSGYSVSDILTVDTADIGGSKLATLSINSAGSGYSDGTYNDVSLVNNVGTGTNATADITVSGGIVTAATVNTPGGGYTTSDTFTVADSDLYNNFTYSLTVTNNGSTNYVISGDDRLTTHSSASNPTISVEVGDTIEFAVNVTGHPFYIVSQLDAQTGGYNQAYQVASTNNGAETGTITLDTSGLIAGTYYYVCANHPAMQGTISVAAVTYGSGAAFDASTVTTGSGFSIRVNNIGSTGTGSNAQARLVISGGQVTEFNITTPGSNYLIGDVLTVNYTDLTYIDPTTGLPATSNNPATAFEFTVKRLNSVSYLDISDLGAGYSVDDVLDLSASFYDATALGLTLFSTGQAVTQGQIFYAGEYIYEVTSAGTTGTVIPSFGSNGVASITTVSGGSGYPSSTTIESVQCEATTGEGTGLLVDITTNGAGAVTSITPSGNLSGDLFQVGDAFTLDNDYINTGAASVSILSGGDNGAYGDSQTYDLTQTGTSGTGADVQVRFQTDAGGNVTSVTILQNGIGYVLGEQIEFDGSLFGTGGGDTEEGEVVEEPTTIILIVDSLTNGSGANFTVASVASSVTNGSATISHNGYFPAGFSLTVNSLAEFNNIQFDAVDGVVTAKKLIASPDGVEIASTMLLNNNAISTTSGNLTLQSEVNSQVVIGGTGALALPVGSDANRPGGPLQGSVRYNTDRNQFEGYNGNYFVSLGGVRDVDGNTFIIGEETPGSNDNNIWFYNDGTQTLRVSQTELNLDTLNTINSNSYGTAVEWVSEEAVTQYVQDEEGNNIQQYVFSGDNVYSIDNDGTYGTVAPTHTTGTVVNGDVNLTWLDYRYDDLNVNVDNIGFGVRGALSINNNALRIEDFGTRESIKTGRDSLTVGFNPFSADSYDLLKLTDGGALQINRGYSSTADNYLTVLDANLQKLELANTKIFTQTSNLDAATGNIVSATMFPWTEAWSGKFMVEIEEQFPIPDAYPRKQYSEISYLVKGNGQDIIYTESNKLYTDVVLADVEADLSGSNIQVRVTELGSATNTFIPVAAERSADTISSSFFTQNIASVYDPNADRVVVFANDASNRGTGGFKVGTISDNGIVFGSQIPHTVSGEQDSSNLLFDSATNRIVLVSEGGTLVGEVNPSNSNITFGTAIAPFSADAYGPDTNINRNKSVQAVMVNGRVTIVYAFNSQIYIRSGTVTGGSTNSVTYTPHGAIGGAGTNILRTIASDNDFLYLIYTTSTGSDWLQKYEVTGSGINQEWTNSQISDRSAQKLVAGGGRLLRVSDGSVAGTLEAQIYDPATGSQLGTTLVMSIDSKIFDVAYDSINDRYMLVAALDYSGTNDGEQNLMGVINVDGTQLSFTSRSTKYSALDQVVDVDRTPANAGDVDALFVGTRSDSNGDPHQIFLTSASTTSNISASGDETVSFASAIENRTTYNIKIVSHTVKR